MDVIVRNDAFDHKRYDALEKMKKWYPGDVETVQNAVRKINQCSELDNSAYDQFCARVNELKDKEGLTFREIAEICGLSAPTIHKALNPNTKNKNSSTRKKVSVLYLELYSYLFDVSPYYLIGKTDDPGCYDIEHNYITCMTFSDNELDFWIIKNIILQWWSDDIVLDTILKISVSNLKTQLVIYNLLKGTPSIRMTRALDPQKARQHLNYRRRKEISKPDEWCGCLYKINASLDDRTMNAIYMTSLRWICRRNNDLYIALAFVLLKEDNTALAHDLCAWLQSGGYLSMENYRFREEIFGLDAGHVKDILFGNL